MGKRGNNTLPLVALFSNSKRNIPLLKASAAKAGLADEEHNCGNTYRIPTANSKGRRFCREIAQEGEGSAQNLCPGKAASALNLTKDSVFVSKILGLDTQ